MLLRRETLTEICSVCHQETTPIEIHGHIQCSVCKVNYSPCCQGESINYPVNETNPITRPDRSGDLTRCYE
jgi:uncharacterized CHY-type Zn-finger protein